MKEYNPKLVRIIENEKGILEVEGLSAWYGQNTCH